MVSMPYETSKAHPRREREGFYSRYCQGNGIDIGCGEDPLPYTPHYGMTNLLYYDRRINPHHDAQKFEGIKPDTFDFIYSSHCLEDLEDPRKAVANWWKTLKYGGYLILFVPHRDLYEGRKTLPPRPENNQDHKHYFLPDRDDPPCTLGLVPLILQAVEHPMFFEYVKTCGERTPVGNGIEYSIELVARKFEYPEF